MAELTSILRTGGIATLTMHRPDARNALSPELITALEHAVNELAQDDALRVLILAGEGKCFCAGMDLKGVISDPAAMADMLRGLSRVMRMIRRLNVPTIARVQGAAVGGGCGLMVMTDFAVTHHDARVGYPEVDLGVCPAVVAPWLIRKIGAGRARAMLLAGGTITGEQGHAVGLATHLVDRAELESATESLAGTLARGGRNALAVTKQWLNELDGSYDDAVFDRAAELSAEVIAGPEAQERLRALFAKA
ncbi:MAG: enoyl-CoA hydratase/isomerase family protein [Phycisphaerales bacterium]|nr:enoyl-CoA hydratase/isomerase family protein [Phycisphaerales bacterium]